jgi:hypothetical protein
VRETPDDAASRRPLAAAPVTPVIQGGDPALKNRPPRCHVLAGDDESERVDPREASQIRGVEGNVCHVEVFQMDD